MLEIWFVCRFLQLQSLMADVPQVAVAAIAGICRKWKVNAVGFTIFDFGFTRIHRPFVASPGGDNFQVGSQGFYAKFKTDLVISLAGCAVADGGCAFFAGNFHKPFCDDRARHRSTEQVFIFIYGMSLYAGEDIFVTEFVDDVFYVKFRGAAKFCSFFQAVKFFFLAAINTYTNYFIVKVFLKPRDNRCCIQAAGVSKYHFFFHVKPPYNFFFY